MDYYINQFKDRSKDWSYIVNLLIELILKVLISLKILPASQIIIKKVLFINNTNLKPV